MATSDLRERFAGSVESVLPIMEWLPEYDRSWLRLDLVAGITVAASVIPEGMAYASLANLPPETGLYAGLVAALAYLFLATSRQVIVGPTSALAILLAGGVGSVAAGSPLGYASLVALTTVLVGVVAVVAWALRLGFLVNFISGSVLTGFSAGAALYIMSTQLGKLFAIEGATGVFYERLWYVATHLAETNPPTLAVGVGGIVLFLAGERFFPRAPNALIVVAASILAMTVTDLPERGVAVVGQIPSGLPSLSVPSISISAVASVLPVAIALFMLSYVQGIGAVETFARKHGYHVDANQELFADGVANLAAGLASGFAVGGSMSRSALNDAVGGKTPIVNAFVALVLVAVLLFLTGLFTNLPEATLAAVVIVAVKSLVDVPALRRLYQVSRSEFAIAAAALLGVLVVGMLWGVFVGVVLSLLVTIGRISDPRTDVMGRVPGTDHFTDRTHHPDAKPDAGALVFRVDAELFFANASTARQALLDRVEDSDRSLDLVVFDLSSSPTIDLEAADMLSDLHEGLASREIDLRLAGMDHEVCELLRAADLEKSIGPIEEDESVAAVIEEWQSSQ